MMVVGDAVHSRLGLVKLPCSMILALVTEACALSFLQSFFFLSDSISKFYHLVSNTAAPTLLPTLLISALSSFI